MPKVYPLVLLVEGRDDVFVIFNLLKQHYQMQNWADVTDSADRSQKITSLTINSQRLGIKDKVGYETLRESLSRELKASDLTRLGVVVDADANLITRWQSLTDVFRQVGYSNIPVEPDPSGTIIEQTSENLPSKVGIWLMPDNKLPGMLENFVSFLVPDHETNPLWNLSEKCTQEACAVSSKIPQAKAQIHTWLAWQEDPGTPLGQAITKKYLDSQAPHAQQFVNWVERLFNFQQTI